MDNGGVKGFCCTGTTIGVFLNSAPYIVIHGVRIWGVNRPSIGTGVVLKICQQQFLTFPRGVAGAKSCCHAYDVPLATLVIQGLNTVISNST